MNPPATLGVVLLLFGVLCAGCAAPSDIHDGPLRDGRGAIQGILVDDRFRPIPGALVLLHELGATADTASDGSFVFRDLRPDDYTFWISAEGHEATPLKATVEEGVWAELIIVARRTSGAEEWVDRIIFEHTAFMECVVSLLLVGVSGSCTFSPDGYSSGTSTRDHRDLNVTWIVTEVQVNQVGNHLLGLYGDSPSGPPIAGGNSTHFYAYEEFYGDHLRLVVEAGGDPEVVGGRDVFHNDRPLRTSFFASGDTAPGIGLGLGVRAAVRAHIVQTVFIGAPEADMETYCVLC